MYVQKQVANYKPTLLCLEKEDDLKMASQDKDEYNYFHIFVKEIVPPLEDTSIEKTLNCLARKVMELSNKYIDNPKDKDGIIYKSGENLIAIFILCNQLEDIHPCRPSSTKIIQWMDPKPMLDMLTASTGIIENYHEGKLPDADTELIKITLQNDVYNFSQSLLCITGLNTLHDLATAAILGQTYKVMLQQRLRHIQIIPEMKQEYEENSIYPWKYTWYNKSGSLTRYLEPLAKEKLKETHPLSTLINQILEATKFRKTNGEKEKDLKNFLSHLFRLEPEKFSLQEPKSLQYPITRLIQCHSFECLWKTRYPERKQATPEQWRQIYGHYHKGTYHKLIRDVGPYRKPSTTQQQEKQEESIV
jgi:hypothetical protein